MVSANQLRDLLEDLNSGKLESGEFLEKFIVASRNLHKCEDPEAVRLARLIESRFAKIAAGHFAVEELSSAFGASGVSAMSSIVVETVLNLVPAGSDNLCVCFSASGSYSPEFGPRSTPIPAQFVSTCS
jgi:hypothetical protein